MHILVGADDCIDRADFAAPCATDAMCLVYHGERGTRRSRVKWHGIAPQEISEPLHCFIATGRTEIYRRAVVNDGSRIRPAAWITALGTLRLWQQSVDFFDQRITIRGQSARCETEHQSCEERDDCDRDDCCQNCGPHGNESAFPE